MTDLYATYDETTASRIVPWHVDKLYADMAIFDPPASFAGTPRPVYLFESGGGRQARRDMNIGSATTSPGVHSIAGMMTNELGAFVVIVSTPPGGLDFAAAEEPGQEYSPECRLSAAMPAMFLRGNWNNPAVVGSVHTLARERRYMCKGGTSAGVWSQLGADMVSPADFVDLVDADAARGGGFRYDYDHCAGHFVGAIGQNRLFTFGEYVTDPAFSSGPSTYVASGSNPAGASVIIVAGDTGYLRRHNRLSIVTTTSYVTGATQNTGTNSFAVTGSSAPIPIGAWVHVTASDANEYEFTVGADFAGGTGNVDARDWGPSGSVSIASGTAIRVRIEYAVTADYAGGAGSVAVYPTVQFPIAAASVVELQYPPGSGYGEDSWAVGYCGTHSMGRVWRSDDSSGHGVPLQEKLDASVDRFVRAGNPRALELNMLLFGAIGDTLHRIDTLTGERSFWARRNSVGLAPLAEHIDLHDESDMAYLAHEIYELRAAAGINVAGIQAYLGGRKSNPLGTDASVPWLKGRSAGWSVAITKAFLQDTSRFGGAFA